MSTKSKRDFHRDATQRPPWSDDSGREAVILSLKQALVTARLTLGDCDAGADPYNSRDGQSPDLQWGRRSRF
ncbi:MAG TPA: hypothetical protein VKC11_06480 [Steroidobacteraceae bacterium]|nr:hypothetical protein [Steroidobacteraceae bacterium]